MNFGVTRVELANTNYRVTMTQLGYQPAKLGNNKSNTVAHLVKNHNCLVFTKSSAPSTTSSANRSSHKSLNDAGASTTLLERLTFLERVKYNVDE